MYDSVQSILENFIVFHKAQKFLRTLIILMCVRPVPGAGPDQVKQLTHTDLICRIGIKKSKIAVFL